MTKRTDIHRPAEFDPTDYRVVDYIDNRRPEPPIGGGRFAWEAYEKYVAWWEKQIALHFPDWKTGAGDHKSIFQCNHCGHPGIRWVAVVEHVPTGAKLAFGDICADRVEIAGRDAFRAKFVKTEAQRQQDRYEKALKIEAFGDDNPGLVEFLKEAAEKDAETQRFGFLSDLYAKLLRDATLTERQIEAAWRSRKQNQEYEARKAAEAKLLETAGPLPIGKLWVEGEIVSTKLQTSQFGEQLKMLVRLDDGNKVWGTVPTAILRAKAGADGIKGTRVRFKADVARSDNDEHFGFFKRPTQAEVVA